MGWALLQGTPFPEILACTCVKQLCNVHITSASTGSVDSIALLQGSPTPTTLTPKPSHNDLSTS